MAYDIQGPVKYLPLVIIVLIVVCASGSLFGENSFLGKYGIQIFVGVLGASFLGALVWIFKNERPSPKSRENFLAEIEGIVGGKRVVLETVLGEVKSYSIRFRHNGKECEFLDRYILDVPRRSRLGPRAIQADIVVRVPVQSAWKLFITGKSGNSFIGRAFDRLNSAILASGVIDLSDSPALGELGARLKIYSSDKTAAVNFLSNPTVKTIINKYAQPGYCSSLSFPFTLKDGYLSLTFQGVGNNIDIYKETSKLKSFLDDLCQLADSLGYAFNENVSFVQPEKKVEEKKISEPFFETEGSLKKTTAIVLGVLSFLLVLSSPFILMVYIMSFDSPSTSGDTVYFFISTAVFLSPFLAMASAWVLFWRKKFKWALGLALGPWAVFILGYIGMSIVVGR